MKRILSSIWFLALIVAVPIIAFLPSIFDKYEVKLIKQENRPGDNLQIYFEDLDSDGSPERIESFSQSFHENMFSFQFFKENGGMVDQVNFSTEFGTEVNHLQFADADNDGHKEIYVYRGQ